MILLYIILSILFILIAINNKKYDKYTILLLVLLILIIYFSLSKFPKFMKNNSPYSPLRDGFSGTSIKKLVQPKKFYDNYYENTINYLTSIYPTAKESFQKLNSLQLASFYNSLNFYYNCSFEYKDNDLGSFDGLSNTWDSLPCKNKYPLPYPPQGIFFNFYTYQKYNIPYVYSDSNENIKYLELSNFGNCRPGIAFTTYKKGQDDGIRPGPGMFWVNCRTIQRHIWYPNGFVNNKLIIQNQKDNWGINIGKSIKWNYPYNWKNGYSDNEFIEVNHFSYGPSGLTTSPGWWYNVFSGTGIFLNLGKTFTSTNKIGGVYHLSKKILKNTNGKNKLIEWFGTSDPIEIVWNFQTQKGCDGVNNPIYCSKNTPCCLDWIAQADNTKGIPFEIDLNIPSTFYEAARIYNKLGPKSSLTYKHKKKAVLAAVNNLDFSLARFSVNVLMDEPIFIMGIYLELDTLQLPLDPNSNGYFVFELVDFRIPLKYKEKILKRDYSEIIEYTENTNSYSMNAFSSNKWNDEFLKDTIDYLTINNLLSVRDPLDIYNNEKVLKCDLSSTDECKYNTQHSGEWLNLYCKQNKLSNEYKCLSVGIEQSKCNLLGENPSC